MFRHHQNTGASRVRFPRMGLISSSEESARGGLHRSGPSCGMITTPGRVRGSSPARGGTVRPIRRRDLDPVKEHGSRFRSWSNLEPLNEPYELALQE